MAIEQLSDPISLVNVSIPIIANHVATVNASKVVSVEMNVTRNITKSNSPIPPISTSPIPVKPTTKPKEDIRHKPYLVVIATTEEAQIVVIMRENEM